MTLEFLNEFDFFAGVPDSQLHALCSWLIDTQGIGKSHIIAANEGNCAALAAGYHLATGKVPVVYLQNSGIGNIINPVASLLNDKVYGIPVIFIIGWRGEPGTYDEPQHVFQGAVTLKLLEDMDIRTFVIDRDTTEAEVRRILSEFKKILRQGKQVAFVVRKGALAFSGNILRSDIGAMKREDVLRRIVAVTGEDAVVSTTGMTSRELFEIREANGHGHQYDFLTVGSMGHSSSIALGIALQRPGKKVWCIDGDGAALMHMGAMAVIGANKPVNFVHIVINNGAHESVGGLPTVAGSIDLVKIADGCGYPNAVCVNDFDALDNALNDARNNSGLSFIEVKCAVGARADLGRPTTAPAVNKAAFMDNLGVSRFE